jgi:dolichyl-phosphate beta-glucosyltransferase
MKNEEIDLSIVVPAFDEARRIERTLLALVETMRSSGRVFELIVSDDGSSDGTSEICTALGIPELRVLRAPVNTGKGAAVRRGMLAARGRYHAFVDADGSTAPRALLELLGDLERDRAEVAIGSRYIDGAHPHGQPLARVLFSRACNLVIRAALLPGIADPHCGMKVFTREASERLFTAQRSVLWSFDIEILARARRSRMRVHERSVPWRDDPRSTVRLRHAWPTLIETLRIRRWLDE